MADERVHGGSRARRKICWRISVGNSSMCKHLVGAVFVLSRLSSKRYICRGRSWRFRVRMLAHIKTVSPCLTVKGVN